MSTQLSIRIILTLTFIALLSACGASSAEQDSTQDLLSTGLTDKPLVKCNKASGSSLSYKVAAQTLGSGFDPNWANLFLVSLPSGFEAGTSFVQFSKGQAVNDAMISYYASPIPFAIFDRQTSTYLSGTYNNLKWDDVKNLISGATPTSFISRVIFVLSVQDPMSAYQVLGVASYNTVDNTTIEVVPSLLPVFYANPSDYDTKSTGYARESVLKSLHPLRGQSGNFSTLADSLCL